MDAKGLFWVLDEEVRAEGSGDSVVLERVCAAFEKKGAGAEGEGAGELGAGARPGQPLNKGSRQVVRRPCRGPGLQCFNIHVLTYIRDGLKGILPQIYTPTS